MTRLAKLLAPAGLILAATAALPAQAQVDGRMATVDVSRTVIGTTAFQTAYEQVNTTYASQNDLRRAKAQERQTLLTKFDKNGDKQVDDTELARRLTSLAGQLVPLFRTDFVRLSWELEYAGARIEVALDRKAIKNFLPIQPGDVPATSANTDELRAWVGFKPDTAVRSGVVKFVEWYRRYYSC